MLILDFRLEFFSPFSKTTPRMIFFYEQIPREEGLDSKLGDKLRE
jgi:hypothetical protein